ncbi:hypothetical protein [Streptomyces sp. NPDC126499]|uniref:hypothetical protein n=1 Tax=Streptomyces sp. NPDC126499 TaxID=3155314 RepID=UPI0033333AB8
MGLYVETRVRTDLDTLWERTQDPAEHQRWDLRFTEITYLPAEPGAEDGPRRFRYAVRVPPFPAVAGTGVSAGERHRAGGDRVSALRFASPHPLSPLAEGSGYWRYLPQDGEDVEDGDEAGRGIRFLTGYDYRPRWGRFGLVADRLVFRPLMGWATAWSFDRLRLWCEHGLTPERARAHWLLELAARALLVAFCVGHPLALAAGCAAALLVPPSPRTPAARRCLRTPPDRSRAPRLLATLERP